LLCPIQLTQIRRVFVFTSHLFPVISCKSPMRTGWRSTSSLGRMVCSCIYTSRRTQMASIWNCRRRMQRMTPESAARLFMSTCANWKSTAIWSGNTQTFLIFTLLPVRRTSVRTPISTRKESISSQIRLANPLLAVNPQHKHLVRQRNPPIRPPYKFVLTGI